MCVCVFARGRQVIINIHDLWVFYSKVSAWKIITVPIFPLTTHSPSPIRSCNNIEIDHNQVLTAAAVNNTLLNVIEFFPSYYASISTSSILPSSSAAAIFILWKNRQIFSFYLARGCKKRERNVDDDGRNYLDPTPLILPRLVSY